MCYFALKGPCLSASCCNVYILHVLHVDISFALLLFFTFCLVLLMLMSSLKLIDTQQSISERYKNIKRRINISVILYESLIGPINFFFFYLYCSIPYYIVLPLSQFYIIRGVEIHRNRGNKLIIGTENIHSIQR